MNNNSSILPQKSSHTGSPPCCEAHAHACDSASVPHGPDASIQASGRAVSRALDAGPSLGPGAENGADREPLLGSATKSHSALINQAVAEALGLEVRPDDWVEGAVIERYDPQTGEIKTFQVLSGGGGG